MRWWIAPVIVSLVMGPRISEAGYAAFQSSKNTSPVGQIQKDSVSVGVEVVDADQTQDIFGTNLLRRRIQPLVITIQNESDQTYHFSKADVDAHYIPASKVARHTYENPLITGVRMIGWVIWLIPACVFPSLRKNLHRPAMHRDVQADFAREEIADADIGPHGRAQGFLFIRPLAPGSRIRVKLIRVPTQEPLTFDIPA